MPRTDDPTTRSIFDLLEEKYPRESSPPSSAAGAPRRPAAAGQPVAKSFDGGSRSLLLATLVLLLATAGVTLSLKPDGPSTAVDAPAAAASGAEDGPISEIGRRAPAVPPAAGEGLRSTAAAPADRPAPEPAKVATLTVPGPTMADASDRRAEPPAPEPGPAAPGPAAPEPAAPAPAAPVSLELLPAPPLPLELPSVAAIADRTTDPDPPLQVRPDGLRPPPGEPAPAPSAAAEIRPPVRLMTPLPAYTEDAWVAGVQGDVVVRARIDKEGTVAAVEVLQGLPHGLTEAAVAAVRRWKFRPASVGGEPVSVDHDLSIRFRL